jgi:cyclophilin family peptidyl-prolyl cis-trans isomerase
MGLMAKAGLWRPLATLLLLLSAGFQATAAEPIKVLMKTDRGNVTLELYPDRAPLTVANFLAYSRRYFYDGLIFHRAVKDYIVQTGGFSYDLSPTEPGEPIVNESATGLNNRRGTLAMARFSDPDSARAQFFVNLADNANLDPAGDKPGYTVFGKVIDGMAVIDAIAQLEVETRGRFENLPVDLPQILSIRELPAP